MQGGLQFVKMHGCGNDYVYIDGVSQELPQDESKLRELSRRLADRRRGVGGDGMILILPSTRADVRMRMFNADGSEAQMCGNGIRCVAKYAVDSGLAGNDKVRVESAVKIHDITVSRKDGEVVSAQVDMGVPSFARGDLPMTGDDVEALDVPVVVAGRDLRVTGVSMGNPHCVVFDVPSDDATFVELGPALEAHSLFPERVNVEFVEVVAGDHLRVRVWERGSGETFACGTGACAVVAAASRLGRAQRQARVELKGGSLDIDWSDAGQLLMAGPAVEVARGVVDRHLTSDLL